MEPEDDEVTDSRWICPLCSRPIANPNDHVKDFHNFTDDAARNNFLKSKYFVFKKVVENNCGAKGGDSKMPSKNKKNAPHFRQVFEGKKVKKLINKKLKHFHHFFGLY